MVSESPFEISTLVYEPHSIKRSTIPNRAQFQSPAADITDSSELVSRDEGSGMGLCMANFVKPSYLNLNISIGLISRGLIFRGLIFRGLIFRGLIFRSDLSLFIPNCS